MFGWLKTTRKNSDVTGTLEILKLTEEKGLKEPLFLMNEGFGVVIWRPSAIKGHVKGHVRGHVRGHNKNYISIKNLAHITV